MIDFLFFRFKAGDRVRPLGSALLFAFVRNSPESIGNVAENTEINRNILVDFRKVNIELDLLCRHGELALVARCPVAEADSDSENQVSVVECLRRGVVTVHTLHTEEAFTVGRNRRNAHQRTADYRINFISKLFDILVKFGANDAAADIDVRTLALIDKLSGFFNIAFLRLGKRIKFLFRLRLIFTYGALYVLRHVNQNRPGSARTGDSERLPDRVRKVVYVIDEVVMFGNRESDSRNVDFLKAVLTDQVTRNVARYGNHGNRVEHCRSNSGNKVRRARAGGGNADARLSGSSEITVGGMGGALLVSG